MRYIYLLIAVTISAQQINSQQITSTELGYQEFTTNIASSVNDEFGNFYHCGAFKGELKINGQVLAVGAGDNDMFLVKLNESGNVIWHKTFGNEQIQNARNIYYLNGSIYLSYSSSGSFQMGTTLLSPYSSTAISVNGISKFNATTGDITWTRRTNTSFSFFGLGSDIRLNGTSGNTVRWGDDILLDSVGGFRQIILHLDTASGAIRSVHRISTSMGSLTVHHIEQMSASRFFLCLRPNGTTAIKFNDQTINLPSTSGHLLFAKADTNLNNISQRIMNPGSIVPFQLGFTRANLAFSPTKDSIYMIANSNSSADNIFYSLDGYNLSLFKKNALVVLDTQFVTKRALIISPHPVTTGGIIQNAVQYKSIALIGGRLYLLGQIFGNNQAPPLAPVPPNVINIGFLPGFTDTFNIEGPSQSFVLKTNLSLSNTTIKWIGNHTPYETTSLNSNNFSTTSKYLSFSHGNDNVWNPWVIDTSLQILRGQMRANADRAETTEFVEHLSDGSLIVAGQSHGKTALDSSYQGIGMGPNRRDLFLLRRTSNGSVSWYKRLYSSFTLTNINRLIVKNDKVYIFINLSQATNSAGRNYIRFDNTTLLASGSSQTDFRLLLVIQPNGASKLIPLDENLGSGKVATIDIYDNGDIAAVTTMASLGLQMGNLQFPNNTGFYFLRLDSNGTIKNALKVYRTSNPAIGALPLQMSTIRIDTGDNTVIVGGLYSMLSGQANHTYLVHNGTTVVDSIITKNHYPSNTQQVRYSLIMKTDLLSSIWETSLGPDVSLGGPQTVGRLGSNIFFTYSRSTNGALTLNGQVVSSDTLKANGVISLTKTGQFRGIKTWRDELGASSLIQTRLKTIGNHIFISGTLEKSYIFDTISISKNGFSDALTLKYDSNLVAKQSHRLATPFYESMNDISIFQDSIYAFAYNAQQTPSYFNNRLFSNPLDLEQNAFLGTFTLRVPNQPPLPISRRFLLYPNPNSGYTFTILHSQGVNANYIWKIFDASGRIVSQGDQVSNTASTITIVTSRHLTTGPYFLLLQSKEGKIKETIPFLVTN